LVKRYDDLTAVAGISLVVDEGDFFGFLGPNGAGKTTTINAIVSLASFQEGSIKVFGHDVVREWREARPLVGVAPQEFNFDRYLSIRDVLLYQAGYYGLHGPQVRKRADMLLERFGLAEKSRVFYTRLSGGQKRRLTLARALMHEPRLLILDEPTAGVDVELRLELWDLVRELNGGGTTIFLTTHYLEEAEALCRNIAIIESGKIVARESTQKLIGDRTLQDVFLELTSSKGASPQAPRPPGTSCAGPPRALGPSPDSQAEILSPASQQHARDGQDC